MEPLRLFPADNGHGEVMWDIPDFRSMTLKEIVAYGDEHLESMPDHIYEYMTWELDARRGVMDFSSLYEFGDHENPWTQKPLV